MKHSRVLFGWLMVSALAVAEPANREVASYKSSGPAKLAQAVLFTAGVSVDMIISTYRGAGGKGFSDSYDLLVPVAEEAKAKRLLSEKAAYFEMTWEPVGKCTTKEKAFAARETLEGAGFRTLIDEKVSLDFNKAELTKVTEYLLVVEDTIGRLASVAARKASAGRPGCKAFTAETPTISQAQFEGWLLDTGKR